MADERKRRRMESNRESARRSRVKKQQQLQQVISDIDVFKRRNAQIASKIEETRKRCSAVETEINTVTAQKMDLEQRLSQLINKTEARALSPSIWSDFSKSSRGEMVANCKDGGSGYGMDGLGIDFDLSLSPWRLMTSAATMSRT